MKKSTNSINKRITLSKKQMGKRLADAMNQDGISIDDFKKKMESWR